MTVALHDLPGKNHPRGWYGPGDRRMTQVAENEWAYRGVTMQAKKEPRARHRLEERLAGYERTKADKSIEPRLAGGWNKPGSRNPRKH